jgi:predicted aminopeptidase
MFTTVTRYVRIFGLNVIVSRTRVEVSAPADDDSIFDGLTDELSELHISRMFAADEAFAQRSYRAAADSPRTDAEWDAHAARINAR